MVSGLADGAARTSAAMEADRMSFRPAIIPLTTTKSAWLLAQDCFLSEERLRYDEGAVSIDRQATVTRLLGDLRAGNRAAFDRLFPLVYGELLDLARAQRHLWHGDHTLNATALVHEAYLKLVDRERVDWRSRGHFGAVAAKAMRHILIDHARRQKAQKRGGDYIMVSLDASEQVEQSAWTGERVTDLLALNEALERLERVSERQARIVEMRFFGGLANEEIAEAIDISLATVKRGWALAQAWLYREIAEAR